MRILLRHPRDDSNFIPGLLALGNILCHTEHPLGISLAVIYDFRTDLEPDDLVVFRINHADGHCTYIAL